MFKYYGGKGQTAHLYPRPDPRFDIIVEPFAGSAKYSLCHFERDVILVDKNPAIINLWKYLQQATPRDILTLPNIEPHDSLKNYKWLLPEEKMLIGFGLGAGAFGILSPTGQGKWNRWPADRARIAENLYKIRHWRFACASYTCIGNFPATWFIDAPYRGKSGARYRKFGSDFIDYEHLGNWSQEREGQVIVAEHTSATWLPFKPFLNVRGAIKLNREAVWVN